MRMSGEAARTLFATARVARLATSRPDGAPHLVPLVFAVAGDVVFSAVDAKPKRTTALRRLDNVGADPRVCLLADEYDDRDWSRLWWVRADGTARVLAADDAEARHGVELLAARYEQYRSAPPSDRVLAIDVARWSGWRASG
jgi:PPOX class probable F420-dependent enzyme